MTKCLWDQTFLKEKADALRITPSVQFWELDSELNVMKFKDEHFKKMIKNFFPFIGVHNLQLGENDKGAPTSTLVLIRGNRCEEIDSKTLQAVTFKILNNMGTLGSDIRTAFYSRSSNPVFNRESLKLIPDLEGKTPFADNLLAAYRFFENGWIEITSNGVSPLKSYSELPEDVIVWNSSVIPKNYKNTETLEVLEKQLTGINANGIHPYTGENIYKKEDRKDLSKEWQEKIQKFDGSTPPTHFRDFVRNLSLNDFGEVDKKSLERIELAIGYLCHRYNNPAGRKYVLFIDKFFDGYTPDAANGRTGKSLLANSLGLIMNLTNLDGKSFTTTGHRNLLSPVTTATEIVHFDDAARKNFNVERLFPLVTGNFHIQRNHKDPYSIDAKNAPKIVITSNHPIGKNDFSHKDREFVVEIGNYYRIQKEENYIAQPIWEEHGRKNFPTSHEPVVGSWDENDWAEYFRYIFECMSLYLSKGLPLGGESEVYQKAQLVKELGSPEILDFIIEQLESFKSGQEYFCDKFYEDMREAFPNEMEDVSGNKMWDYLKRVGRFIQIYPNKATGKVKQERLDKARWKRWLDQGLRDHIDRNGNKKDKGDRVYVFKISKSPLHQSNSSIEEKKDEGNEPNLDQFF